ncbi:MAG: hypothetical protein ACOZAR_05415 [Patescibacteria group bacterium]
MLNNNTNVIEEKVGVVISFVEKMTPLLLIWRRRRIAIKKLNLLVKKKIGKNVSYYFFVSDADNNGYKLCFNLSKMEWILDEITF